MKTVGADAFPGHGRQVGPEEEIRCLGVNIWYALGVLSFGTYIFGMKIYKRLVTFLRRDFWHGFDFPDLGSCPSFLFWFIGGVLVDGKRPYQSKFVLKGV